MSFDTLPVELYQSIFAHVPTLEVPQIVLAVSRAIPLSPVPLHHLYHNITIKRADQAVGLYTNLSRSQTKSSPHGHSYLDDIASWINKLSIESWDVDAEVLINIFRLLLRSCPSFQPRSLNIWIGPRNFAPEHLEKLFVEPLPSLQYLSLRFRPYVQKAAYQQFLKGVYFDSTLKAIASWPSPTLHTLSIIQDPMDHSTDRAFAQPLVFFRLDIAAFIHSPALLALKSLRFRIPARPVARNLCSAPSPQSALNANSLPDIKFLDLSTSGVLDTDLHLLLVRLPLLEHLILDACHLSFTTDLHDGEWHALGKKLATIGVQRAREREKLLKEWDEIRELSRSLAKMDGKVVAPVHEGKKAKRGRKGLATATISLRTPDTPVPSFVMGQPVQSYAGGNSLSTNIRDSATIPVMATPVKSAPPASPPLSTLMRPDSKPDHSLDIPDKKLHFKGKHKAVTRGKEQAKAPEASKPKRKPARKIRVLPSLPSLLSLSISLSSRVVEDRHSLIRRDFEQGWVEGISQLENVLARMRTSANNGVRVMRLATGTSPGQKVFSLSSDSDRDSNSDSSQGSDGNPSNEGRLRGLEDIDLTDSDAFGLNKDGIERSTILVPVLCFSGPGKEGHHVNSCGHSFAWEVMNDDQ